MRNAGRGVTDALIVASFPPDLPLCKASLGAVALSQHRRAGMVGEAPQGALSPFGVPGSV